MNNLTGLTDEQIALIIAQKHAKTQYTNGGSIDIIKKNADELYKWLKDKRKEQTHQITK
jgi:hypothetical protein